MLTENSVDSGNIALNFCDSRRVVELVGRILQTQVEEVLLQVGELNFQLFNTLISLAFIILHQPSLHA